MIVPSYCPFDVICTISDLANGAADIIVDTNVGSNPPQFNIERLDSLASLGQTQSVTCKARSKTNYPPRDENGNPIPDGSPGNPTPIESPEGTTRVVPKNPCIDPNFVSINVLNPPLIDTTYNVGQGPKQILPAHAQFTLRILPGPDHNLCGPIEVEPLYEGNVIQIGDPVTYNSVTDIFTVNTNDPNFENTMREYGLRAYLLNWPPSVAANFGVTTRTAVAEIDFNNACESPSLFRATRQNSPISGGFSGVEITNQLTQFEVTPTGCKIDYTCKSITSEDPSQTTGIPQCNDVFFDGIYDGSGTDGKFGITPTRNDYISGKYKPGRYTVCIEGTV